MTAAIHRGPWAVGVKGPILKHELVRADLIRYAGASGDFFPLHTDDGYARSVGFDGVFAHGMYLAGLLATAVTNWVGIGALRSYQVRFTSKAWPGDVLESRLEVIDVSARGAALRLEIDCRLVDSAGAIRIVGRAVADVEGTPDTTRTPTVGGPT
ncbi:MaoC domain protein dehydratase [Mycolicibacterium rhodesiae JS60]|nr:MaoC domain protein dehydratase [Mycolicibacterium rhodesiae JS60]